MTNHHQIDLHLACDYCGHESHIVITTVSLPNAAVVCCPSCGGQVGTVGDLDQAEEPDHTPDIEAEGEMA